MTTSVQITYVLVCIGLMCAGAIVAGAINNMPATILGIALCMLGIGVFIKKVIIDSSGETKK